MKGILHQSDCHLSPHSFSLSAPTTLHNIKLHYTTLHYTTLTILYYIALHYTTLLNVKIPYTTLTAILPYTSIQCHTVLYTTLHSTTLHFTTLHCISDNFIIHIHCIKLHYNEIHYTYHQVLTHQRLIKKTRERRGSRMYYLQVYIQQKTDTKGQWLLTGLVGGRVG